MTTLDNYEKYEVHIASSQPTSKEQKNAIIDMGFNQTKIVASHKNIFVIELFSHYSFNKYESMDTYNKGKAFILNNSGTPFIIEREVVALQEIVNGNSEFYRGYMESSELTQVLRQNCKFDGIFSSAKQADIHFSLPTKAMTKELAETFHDLDVTYVCVRRSGAENMPMEVAADEEWTSYTIQFIGDYAVQNAKHLYHLFINTLSKAGGFSDQAIIKYEIVTDIFSSGGYLGVPAIKSDKRLVGTA